jgi:hypothetical protein
MIGGRLNPARNPCPKPFSTDVDVISISQGTAEPVLSDLVGEFLNDNLRFYSPRDNPPDMWMSEVRTAIFGI